MLTRTIRWLAPMILIGAMTAHHAHAHTDTDTGSADLERAQTRLQAARAALDAARREYDAARAQLAQARGTTTAAGARAQPDESGDNEETPELGPTSFLDGWDFSIEAGIVGSSGNSENFSGRVRLDAERATETMETSAYASYLFERSGCDRTASRGEIGLRNDWLLDGPWRLFATGLWEYDEFQAWRHRLSAAAGVGYEFVNNDTTTLVGLLGAGASYETGNMADEEIVPEGLLGLDLTHKLSTKTTFTASTRYFPDLEDPKEFRLTNRAGIEVEIDEETGMTLGAGAEHRHDSNPGAGTDPNDVDYYLTLGWKF